MSFECVIKLVAEIAAMLTSADRHLCVRTFDRSRDERYAEQRTHQADRNPLHGLAAHPED